MTNGVFEIKDSKGDTFVLTLGYNAAMEFEKRYFGHLIAKDSPNQAIMLTDLIYSGLYCNSVKNGSKIYPYSFAYNLVEDIAGMDNFIEVSTSLWAEYYQSKWGQDFEKRLMDAKKKIVEEIENQ